MLSLSHSEQDEYTGENSEPLTQQEAKIGPNPQYMTLQSKLNWGMRTKVVEWLIVVWNWLDLKRQVLYHAVNILDRFLSVEQVEPDQLPLWATASLISAVNCSRQWPHYSKEQIVGRGYPSQWPHYSKENIVDRVVNCSVQLQHYSEEQMIEIINLEPTPAVLKAKSYIFERLGDLHIWPGPTIFLHKINKFTIEDTEVIPLGHYLLEIMLRDERFVSSPPDFTAAVAYCLAGEMLGEWLWVS